MQKTASKHSNTIQVRASAMMIIELSGHVTFGNTFPGVQAPRGRGSAYFSLGLQPSQEKLKTMLMQNFGWRIAHSLILSIFRIVPGMYRKQWLCKILI